MTTREIRVGVVGLGVMGRTHLAAYRDAARDWNACRVVAVADRNLERLSGRIAVEGNLQSGSSDEPLFDPRSVRLGTDPNTVIEDPEVELVSICTPTDSHVELARRALAAGKHVLLEKPVSLDPDEIDALAADAARGGRICMPAMCMRFWPGWSWLRQAVDDRRYGKILRAAFQRDSSRPTWNPSFYGSTKRSGGALFDLHVHDVDLVHWLFGPPQSVSSTGSLENVRTAYDFVDGPRSVVASASWDQDPGFPFRMHFVVTFERAVAEFDLHRSPPLEITTEARSETPELPPWTGYDGEVRAMLDAVRRGDDAGLPTLAEAAQVTRTLQQERDALVSA